MGAAIRPEKKGRYCHHGRQRVFCKECGGRGICDHGKQRYWCKLCVSDRKCEHNWIRYKCPKCKERRHNWRRIPPPDTGLPMAPIASSRINGPIDPVNCRAANLLDHWFAAMDVPTGCGMQGNALDEDAAAAEVEIEEMLSTIMDEEFYMPSLTNSEASGSPVTPRSLTPDLELASAGGAATPPATTSNWLPPLYTKVVHSTEPVARHQRVAWLPPLYRLADALSEYDGHASRGREITRSSSSPASLTARTCSTSPGTALAQSEARAEELSEIGIDRFLSSLLA
jgi:hypothetical protein